MPRLSLEFGTSHSVDTLDAPDGRGGKAVAIEILPFVREVCKEEALSKNDLSLLAPQPFIGHGLLSCVLSGTPTLLLSCEHGAVN